MKYILNLLSLFAISLLLFFVHCSKDKKESKSIQSLKNSQEVGTILSFMQDKAKIKTSITVSYKDFNGQIHTDGIIEVPESVASDVKATFSNLLNSDFRIQNVSPLSKYADTYEALTQNATFAFTGENDTTYLLINPVQNPSIIRGSTLGIGTSSSKSLIEDSKSSSLFIFPVHSLFAINHNQSPLIGKVQSSTASILSKNKFIQVLQPQGDSNQLLFGFFQYQATSKMITPSSVVIKKTSITPQDSAFSYEPLPDSIKDKLISGGTWKKGCPVPLERLAYIRFIHYDFDGNVYNGSLVSADVVAPEVVEVMKHLYYSQKPVEGIAERGKGGTGMFNCRAVTGGNAFSLHSYGTALDLSYYHNPYVGEYVIDDNAQFAKATIVPEVAPLIFLARSQALEGFNEEHRDFIQHLGLSEWGGTWFNRTDYMHFQTSPFFSYLFPLLSYEDGRKLFALEKTKDALLHQFSLEGTEVAKWQLLAKMYSGFADVFVTNIDRFSTLGEDGFFEFLLAKLQANSSARRK